MFHKSYTAEQDAMRFKIFKPKYEELLAHNEKYARGEIYYPDYTIYNLDQTEQEKEYDMGRPQHWSPAAHGK